MPCDPGLRCDDDICIDPAACLVTWGTDEPRGNASVIVSPITADGRVGGAARTSIDAALGLEGEALGADMLVRCGPMFYAAVPAERSVAVFRLESDLSATFSQRFPLPVGNAPGTLRALECVNGNSALVAVVALDTEDENSNVLRGSVLPLGDDGLVLEETGFDTTTISASVPFDSVRTAWSEQLGRGFLVFDSPQSPTVYFRNIGLGGTGVSISSGGFNISGTLRERVGGIEVTPSSGALAIVGLLDGGDNGTGGVLAIESGNLQQGYVAFAAGTVAPPILADAGPLTRVRIEDTPPLLAFSGDGVAVLASFDADPPSPATIFAVEGSGPGAVLLSEDGTLLVVVNDDRISTFDATVGVESLGDPDSVLQTAAQPAHNRAASLLSPCPQ